MKLHGISGCISPQSDGMIQIPIHIATLMNLLHTVCWNEWPAAVFFCENDVVLDYGCGKGRVSFFLSHQTKAKAIGIEYDDHIYAVAQKNQISAQTAATFCLAKAEAYSVPQDVNRCYFFNPFSVEILHKVMARILESWYEHPREIYLFFYYPADEYISFLMTVDELEFYDEIECEDLFEGNDPRERIMIFNLPYYEIEE